MNSKIRIILADDHVLFLQGIKTLLDNNEIVEVLDVVNDGKELLDVLNVHKPDVILLDVNMPKLNGLEALRKINMQHSGINIIMLSTYNDEHLIQKSKEYGAKGYILKNTTKEELISSIQKVMINETCFPERIPAKAPSEFEQTDALLKQYQLTKRELEILGFIRDGFTNQQIAGKLFLSIYTVETHRKNIMQKLGLKSPNALVKFILENGI